MFIHGPLEQGQGQHGVRRRRIERREGRTVFACWQRARGLSLASLHRHTLRQIPWFIDIGTTRAGGVVGEELQGNDVQQG